MSPNGLTLLANDIYSVLHAYSPHEYTHTGIPSLNIRHIESTTRQRTNTSLTNWTVDGNETCVLRIETQSRYEVVGNIFMCNFKGDPWRFTATLLSTDQSTAACIENYLSPLVKQPCSTTKRSIDDDRHFNHVFFELPLYIEVSKCYEKSCGGILDYRDTRFTSWMRNRTM